MSQFSYNPAPFALGIGALAQRGVESGIYASQHDEQIAMERDQRRIEAERYAVQHDADTKFYQGLQQTMGEEAAIQQAALQAMTPGQEQRPASTNQTDAAAQPGVPAGSMGPSMDEGGQTTPTAPTLTPNQAAQGAAAAGTPGLEEISPAQPTPQGVPFANPQGNALGKGMGPPMPEAGHAPGEPGSVPQGGHRIQPRESFAQRLLRNVGPATFAHMSPKAQQVAEQVFGEQAEYMVRQQREAQDYREMMDAGVFAFYQANPNDPDAVNKMVDDLEAKTRMLGPDGKPLITEKQIFQHASPQVQEEYERRQNSNMERAIDFLSHDVGPDGQMVYSPERGAMAQSLRLMGPNYTKQVLVHEFPHFLDMAAKGAQARQNIAARGEQTRMTEDNKQQNRMDLESKRAEYRRGELDAKLTATKEYQDARLEQADRKIDLAREQMQGKADVAGRKAGIEALNGMSTQMNQKVKETNHDIDELQKAMGGMRQSSPEYQEAKTRLGNLRKVRDAMENRREDINGMLNDARTEGTGLEAGSDKTGPTVKQGPIDARRGASKPPSGPSRQTPNRTVGKDGAVRPGFTADGGRTLEERIPKHPDPRTVTLPPDTDFETATQNMANALRQMASEGVNIDDDNAVAEWIDAHKATAGRTE